MSQCPCEFAFGMLVDNQCDGHTPAVVALARQIAAEYQQPNPTVEQVGWFIDDAVTIVGHLGDGPFEVVEAAEGLKPEGYPRYGFDGTAVIVDDVWFAVLSDKGGSDLVRLSDAESTRLWKVSVGEPVKEE